MAHILIAEDETAINNLIRSNLKLVGHSCAQAFTGPEALELARCQSFDLVLLDVMLPGLGLSLCFAIARRHGALLEFESKPGHGTRATVTFTTSQSVFTASQHTAAFAATGEQ